MVLNRVPPEAARSRTPPACRSSSATAKAFVTSVMAGLGVVESEARSAAADEVRALAEDVSKRLG